MSRLTKWKLEKAKVKVVFRLQFHATHIPQTGWNNLFISFIPADSGKATAKTTKANVRNGTCKWADPIYETTRLLQDAKTKQYEEKLYKLVVAMGTSRSSLLGEADINLSDYVDASKPTVVALPLHGSDSGAILHVTVQLLTSKTGFREFEQQREVSDRGLQANTEHDSGKVSTSGDAVVSRTDKVNPRVKFKPEKELPSLDEESGFNEEYADLAGEFDGSSNTSGSLYAEKHDNSSAHEIDCVKSGVSGDLGGISPTQSSGTKKGPSGSDNHFLVHDTSESARRWGAENTLDSEVAIAYEENIRLRGVLEATDLSIHELRREISSLQSHIDDLGAEAQKMTEELAVEISSGQELEKEVSYLKSECLKFKDDLEYLRHLKMNPLVPRKKTSDTNCNLLQGLSLRWLKGLSVVEDKVGEVQNKVRLGLHGNDLMFLLSDLESLVSILQDLKRVTEVPVYQLDEIPAGIPNTKVTESPAKADDVMSDTGLGVELCLPEGVLLPGLLVHSHGAGSVDATNAMQGEIFKLLRELDESKAEREILVRKMDQMECYYEALIQELEENQKQILGELQNLRNEHSSCVYTISSTKAQMEAMHRQLNGELLQLADERCNLDSLNKELERRAVSSEAALRRARLNYSIAVNQLQKDLEVLSLQVLSMYETNENLIRKAFSENSESLLQECQEVLTLAVDAEDSCTDRQMVSQNHITATGVKNQISGGDRLIEDLKRSLKLQEELYLKIQEELNEMHLANVHLDVYSVTLQQALLVAVADSRLAKEEMHALAKELEISSQSNDFLKLKLQNVMDDICALSEEKVISVSRCKDLASQNKTLEANLKSVSDEKRILSEKTGELERLVNEGRSYKSKYEDCNTDKAKLANLLEQAATEKGHLLNEISLLHEELRTTKRKGSDLSSLKDHLQKIVDDLRERLESLLACGDEQLDGLSSCDSEENRKSEFEEFVSTMLQLEALQHNFFAKVLQIVKENKDLLNERDIAQLSLTSAKSEIEVVKQKFQCDVLDMVSKFNASSALVEKLQTDLEVVSKRLNVSSQAEEKYTKMAEDLLSDFAKLEAVLQELFSKNRDLAEEILALGSVANELETNKLIIDKITQENLSLSASLQNKTVEINVLAVELNNLTGTLGSLQNELSLQKGMREHLEAEVSNLNAELKERDEKLDNLDQQKAELSNLKQQLLDMASEKSSVYNQLSHLEENLKKSLEESYYTSLDIQLLDMHALLIAADVTHTVVVEQYNCHVEELLQRLEYSNQHLQEVNKKNDDLATMVSYCLASKADYAEEIAKLQSHLECLKSESETSVSMYKALEHSNNLIASELEECKKKGEYLESRYANAKNEHMFEIEELKCLLENCQKEIDDLIIAKGELEIRFLVLKEKVDEEIAFRNFQGENNEELTMLQKQCNELTRKLSEQILKTEEFKNLSLHFKELKDKAETEHIQVRGKREAEGSSVAMQESLRIAFIKEQYETKLQEVRSQLSISKKHGEEMLWKLQDAFDEIENSKKCEASLLQRNEELLVKIAELEAEIQSVLSDNRERFMAYDELMAELDCSMMSLDCCNEEKKQLMASLQECNDEKSRLADEVELMREQIEHLKRFMGSPENKDGCHNRSLNYLAQDENMVEKSLPSTSCLHGESSDAAFSNSSTDQANNLANNINVGEMNGQPLQGAPLFGATEEIFGLSNGQNNILLKDTKHVGLVSDQLKGQNILSIMDILQKELEKLQTENTLFQGDVIQCLLDGEGLQSERLHLEKVTEELGNISSLYNDSSRSGSSMERVLALELELAESLQAKKKSSIQFQSSFLKLHSDEAAVFQSFRDINELIKDLLEMKGRYSAMEAELKEMHERYSQLSLQFAEVEGERQKLMMTLKNVRSPKRLLSRSPTSSHEESSL